MSNQKQPVSGKPLKSSREFDFGSAIAIGVSLGLVFGAALGNVAIGLSGGLLVATLINAYHEWKQQKKGAKVALAMSVGALLLLVAIYVVTATS